MKKILLTLLLGSGILAIQPAAAVEVGDIYYSDKTFSATYNSSKMPIGLVYWVYPSKDHGYIMQLNQPAAMTFANAKTHCANYTTLNTTIGTWRLPDFHETLLMAKESWNGVSNDKFNVLKKTGNNYGHWRTTADKYQLYFEYDQLFRNICQSFTRDFF